MRLGLQRRQLCSAPQKGKITRYFLGGTAAVVAMGAWVELRPNVAAEMPGAGFITTGIGVGVFKFLAPRASIAVLLFGTTFFVTGTALGG